MESLHDKNLDQNKEVKSKATINDLLDDLKKGVQDVFKSDKYKQWLDVATKFHSYSYRNTLLIYTQKPEATLVKGFKAWDKDFNRQVQKGEKGIKIIAPMVFKKDEEKKTLKAGEVATKEESYVRYKVVNVFDVAQTKGDPLPKLGTDLVGSLDNFEIIKKALTEISPVPIQYKDLSYEDGLKGYFSSKEQVIVLNTNLSNNGLIKTLIHEIAHAELHDSTKEPENPDFQKVNKNEKEVQAESIAYIISSNLGLDTSEYSFPYIASWSQDKETEHLEKHLEIIQKKSSELISKIENIIDKEQDLAKPIEIKKNELIPINDIEQNIQFSSLDERLTKADKIIDINKNGIDDRLEKENYSITHDPFNSNNNLKINSDLELER